MAGITCKKCGALMALSDKFCLQCGAEADKSQLAAVFLEKAESLREQGLWYEAADQYRKALKEALAPGPEAQAWQRLGLVLEKLADKKKDPALLDQAHEAYEKALALEPGNEMIHQLWIANMSRRGLNGEAVARYNKLLAENPGDEMAARMKKVAALAAEFKMTPVQMVSSVAAENARGPRFGLFTWFLVPTPFKIATAVGSTLLNLASCVYFALAPAVHTAAPSSEEEAVAREVNSLGMGDMVQSILGDPAFLLFSTVLTGLWAFYLLRARKRK